MRILHIIPWFGVGGAETMCETLSYELKSSGHDVFIISLYTRDSVILERIKKNNIKVFSLDKKEGFDFKCLSRLKKLLIELKPDIIHTHLYAFKYAFLASRRLKTRIIHTVHNLAEKETTRINRIFNYFYFRSKRVIVVALSGIIKSSILKTYKINKNDIPTIFNGVNFSKYDIKKNYSIGHVFSFLHVGRFSNQKNHDCLIRSFSNLIKDCPNCRLNLIGIGENEKKIKVLVKELGLTDNVCFLGLQENVNKFMVESDAFILTSFYEGVPISLIEAMGSGLPCIVTRVGGMQEMIIDGSSGLLCNVDAVDICNKMKLFIYNDELRETCGINARNSAVNNFSSSKMCEKYIEIYTKGTL